MGDAEDLARLMQVARSAEAQEAWVAISALADNGSERAAEFLLQVARTSSLAEQLNLALESLQGIAVGVCLDDHRPLEPWADWEATGRPRAFPESVRFEQLDGLWRLRVRSQKPAVALVPKRLPLHADVLNPGYWNRADSQTLQWRGVPLVQFRHNAWCEDAERHDDLLDGAENPPGSREGWMVRLPERTFNQVYCLVLMHIVEHANPPVQSEEARLDAVCFCWGHHHEGANPSTLFGVVLSGSAGIEQAGREERPARLLVLAVTEYPGARAQPLSLSRAFGASTPT
jgi:hypothetical protein